MSNPNRKTLAVPFVLFALSGCHHGTVPPSEGTEERAGSAGAACLGAECPKELETPAGTSCAATLCAVNTYCDDLGGTAKCLPLPSCDTQQCPEGQHCELVQVQCIRAPCPPQPACQPNGA